MFKLDSPKKMQMDKTISRRKVENNSNSKKYDVEAIWNMQFILENQKIVYKASIIGYCEKLNSKIIISGS